MRWLTRLFARQAPKAPTPDPAEAEAALIALMLAEIWDKSKAGGELIFGARDYNAGCDFVAPGRALLTRIAGDDWEQQTTADTIAHVLPDEITITDILPVWFQMSYGRNLSFTTATFVPRPDREDVAALLTACGYLSANRKGVRWTDKASPALVAAGEWTADGASEEDLRTTRAKASSDFRQQKIRDKAQALLDSMPPKIRAEFDTMARTGNVVQCYDFLYAHYERLSYEKGCWRDTPRPIETPSKPGKLNRPDMGLNVAVEMYDIASDGWMTTLKSTPPDELKQLLLSAKRGRR